MLLHHAEAAFVHSFVNPDRQQRWLSALANNKRRSKILDRLADSRDLQLNRMQLMDRKLNFPESIYSYFIAFGARYECHAISEIKPLDGRDLPTLEALQKCVGFGVGTVLSFIPGRLCFYEQETPSRRWILRYKL
jgi:hypothetical protein